MSRLLAEIEAGLGQSTNPGTLGELQTRKAIYFARTGRFDESKQIVQLLRAEASLENHPRTAILVILVEGVIDLYENFGAFGYDRILRANLLAIATGDAKLVATTSSWRAHIEFERSNFLEMAEAIQRVCDSEKSVSSDASARIARIMSDCFSLIGDRDSSKYWFQVAHKHAVDFGDQAMLDTLIYNSVAFAVSRLRSTVCLGAGDPEGLRLLETALASSRAYQALIGNRAFTHFVDVCGARLFMLKGDFSSCIDLLLQLDGIGPMAINNFSSDLLNTEIAYCHAKLGQRNSAVQSAGKVIDRGYPGIDADDRLAAAWMWYEMALIDEIFGAKEEAENKLNRLKDEYKLFISGLTKAISSLNLNAA